MGYNYSEQEEADIKRMWLEDGKSTSEIARWIGNGVTRNAIIGVIHRRNWLRENNSQGQRPRTPRTHSQPLPEGHITRVLPKAKQLEQLRQAAGTLQPIGPENDFAPHGTCQYIHGDPTTGAWCMCGHPVVKGRSWCETHMPVVFDQFKTEQANARWRVRQASQQPDRRQFNGKRGINPGWHEDAA